MKKQRQEFAHRGGQLKQQVMFSDESHFELRFGNQGYCGRRPVGWLRFKEKFMKKTVSIPQW
jgi:hypothetical protein